jgi:hypothetical protein
VRCQEQAPQAVAQPATRAALVVAPGPATVLALQRTFGNRAVVRMLQRRKDHKGWSLAVADAERTDIDSATRPWHTTRKVKEKKSGKVTEQFVGSTLHHMISKSVLDLIAADLQAALSSNDTDTGAAAVRFNKALTKAARAAGITEGDREKQLWNMFLNLEAGPSDVIGDPGEGFDASYVAVEDERGGRRFVETAVSTHLRKLDQAYRTGRRAAGGAGELDADVWNKMAEALESATDAAAEASTLKNIRIDEDQWMSFMAKDKETGELKKRWTRSGARWYPGLELGRKLFPAVAGVPAPVADIAPVTETFRIHNDADNAHEPSLAFLTFSISAAAIDHVCKRHTYRYFTTVTSDMKATNTFFRDTTLDAAGVRALLVQALPDIVKAIRSHIEDAATGIEDYDDLLADKDLSLAGIPTGAGELYIKAGVTHDPTGESAPRVQQAAQATATATATSSRAKRRGGKKKEDEAPAPAQRASHGWTMRLKTAAPEGPGADAYTRDELVALKG